MSAIDLQRLERVLVTMLRPHGDVLLTPVEAVMGAVDEMLPSHGRAP